MRNITFSADEADIDAARARAVNGGTTLQEEFRQWLKKSASGEDAVARFHRLREKLRFVGTGRKYTREEMNER